MLKVTEIAFSCYPVTDMARARKFYEGVLGLKPTMVFGEPGGCSGRNITFTTARLRRRRRAGLDSPTGRLHRRPKSKILTPPSRSGARTRQIPTAAISHARLPHGFISDPTATPFAFTSGMRNNYFEN